MSDTEEKINQLERRVSDLEEILEKSDVDTNPWRVQE